MNDNLSFIFGIITFIALATGSYWNAIARYITYLFSNKWEVIRRGYMPSTTSLSCGEPLTIERHIKTGKLRAWRHDLYDKMPINVDYALSKIINEDKNMPGFIEEKISDRIEKESDK